MNAKLEAAAAAQARQAREQLLRGAAATASLREEVVAEQQAVHRLAAHKEVSGHTPRRMREAVDLVGSHGSWKRPCLQTAHMAI